MAPVFWREERPGVYTLDVIIDDGRQAYLEAVIQGDNLVLSINVEEAKAIEELGMMAYRRDSGTIETSGDAGRLLEYSESLSLAGIPPQYGVAFHALMDALEGVENLRHIAQPSYSSAAIRDGV